MKRLLLGLGVLGTLVVYSLNARQDQPKINSPVSLVSAGAKSTTAATNKNTGSTTSSNTSPIPTPAPTQSTTGAYKDGTYTGSTEDAYYGNVQIKASIQSGKIAAVTFLQYPHTHSTSVYINQQAMPYLEQEAIKAQSAKVDIVSGATYTSQAFIQSLSSALSQAV